LNPNISWDNIKNNLNKWKWDKLVNNQFSYHPYFRSEHYKKKLVRQFLDNCWLELINKACRPDRIFNWNEYACDEFPEDYRLEYSKLII